MTTLRTLAKTCNFRDCLKDTLLRDRIVLGTQSQNTRKRLLQDRKLTLEKCIDICRSAESYLSQLKYISKEIPDTEAVNVVGQRPKRSMRNRPLNTLKNKPEAKAHVICHYCGTEHPAIKQHCPAWGKTCLTCGTRNHFSKTTRVRAIRDATQVDKALQLLKATILHGWSDKKQTLASEVCPYFSIRDELSIQDGLIFRGERVIVPTKLRSEMKTKLHSSHMGAEACLRRARECFFWPGMSAEIRKLVAQCETCSAFGTSYLKETLMPHELPSRPWQKIAVDLLDCDKREYLVTVDYISNYWDVDQLPSSTTATAVIQKLKAHFARYGSPEILISDNGPQFVSADFFAQFPSKWDFEHRSSSTTSQMAWQIRPSKQGSDCSRKQP